MSCEFDGCGRVRQAKGLCDAHYRQRINGVELRPIKQYRGRGLAAQDDSGRIECGKCHRRLPVADFYRHGTSSGGYWGRCKSCVSRDGRFQRYGLSVEAVSKLLESQRDLCAICGTQFEDGNFRVDHDHSCCPEKKSCGKCIRGLLCNGCNIALGALGDTEESLMRAVKYLRSANNVLNF